MRIRIVDTSMTPNTTGNANIGDNQASAILDLFLLNRGVLTEGFTLEQRLSAASEELKRIVVSAAKKELRRQREFELDASFELDTADFD